MIFVTSGSMLPFDRLFKHIDQAIENGVLTDKVFAQIGEGAYEPRHCSYTRFIEKTEYDDHIANSTLVIAHAGIGVIMECLAAQTPLLVLPRRVEFGEHVNDHQVTTAEKFVSLGHILSFDEAGFAQSLTDLVHFQPKPRSPNVEGIGNRVAEFLNQCITKG